MVRVTFDGEPVETGAGIGVAVFLDDDTDTVTLRKAAGRAGDPAACSDRSRVAAAAVPSRYHVRDARVIALGRIAA